MTVPSPLALPPWLDRQAWPYTPHAASLAAGRLHFIDEGQGAPVVFSHGTPTWSFEWRHAVAALRASHRVLAVDHLGFGLSDAPKAAVYTPEAHAERFAEWMEHVYPRGPLALVVHDFGGPIALSWALDHPDRISQLIIVNTWMWPFDDDPVMVRRATMVSGRMGRFLYRYLNASQRLIMPSAYGDRKRLTPAIHRQYTSVFPDPDTRGRVLYPLAQSLLGSSDFFGSLWARRARLATIPAHIMWGLRDSAFPPRMLARWRQALPHARVVEFPTAGHWPHEEEPEAFCAALRRAVSSPDAESR